VCDSFDAMTSPRAYATEKTIEAALDELVRNAGTQFDPDVVQAFLEVVAAQGAPRIALASYQSKRHASAPTSSKSLNGDCPLLGGQSGSAATGSRSG